VYTKHQKLPQTSKHYKQSSLHSSVLAIVRVPFGVSASVASSLCGVLSFRGFILVGRECVPVGGGRKASLALGLARPVCRAPVPVDRGVPRSSEGAGAPRRSLCDDWDVYYERGREPKESIIKYEAARSEGDYRRKVLMIGTFFFLIVGGLYSVTALRKLTMRVTVIYSPRAPRSLPRGGKKNYYERGPTRAHYAR
jgi:hypothetical protein